MRLQRENVPRDSGLEYLASMESWGKGQATKWFKNHVGWDTPVSSRCVESEATRIGQFCWERTPDSEKAEKGRKGDRGRTV